MGQNKLIFDALDHVSTSIHGLPTEGQEFEASWFESESGYEKD